LGSVAARKLAGVLRGDAGSGNAATMREAEARGLWHLLKLRQMANVRRHRQTGIDARTDRRWRRFAAKESALRSMAWSREGRVIMQRRRAKEGLILAEDEDADQPKLSFSEIDARGPAWDYSLLATSLDENISAFGELYRDRGDSENVFDELKNQQGWGGFATQDLARRRWAARLLVLFYDWRNIFVRQADPNRHHEAIASWPLWLSAKSRAHAPRARADIRPPRG